MDKLQNILQNRFLPLAESQLQKNQIPKVELRLDEDIYMIMIGVFYSIGNTVDSSLHMVIASMMCNNEFTVYLPPQVWGYIFSFLENESSQSLRDYNNYANTLGEMKTQISLLPFTLTKENNDSIAFMESQPKMEFYSCFTRYAINVCNTANSFMKKLAKRTVIKTSSETQSLLKLKLEEIEGFKLEKGAEMLPFSNETDDIEFVVLINTLKNLLVKYLTAYRAHVDDLQTIIDDKLTLNCFRS